MKAPFPTTLLLAIASLVLTACGKQTEETTPVRRDVTELVFASGELEAEGTYQLTAQSSGYLVSLNINEGDIITRGQLLATVDSRQSQFNAESSDALYQIAQQNAEPTAPSLVQAQQNIEIARQKADLDSLNMVRYRRLMATKSVSRAELENSELQYETSQASYRSAIKTYEKLKVDAQQQVILNRASQRVNRVLSANGLIRAVVDGKVYQCYKEVGDYVKTGEVIATIGSANKIYAKVSIDETSIAKVALGQPVTLKLNADPERLYHGRVSMIYPAFDKASQSFTVRVDFIDTLRFSLANTQLQANITVGEIRQALLIPNNYLSYGSFVQIKGVKEPIKVKTGFVSSEWVQVTEGLDEQSVIVTDQLN